MDWTIITYSTFMLLGYTGLYSLRNTSIKENFFFMGPIIGFATLIQRLTGLGILTFIIVAIIKSNWYTPFISLIIGFVFSLIIAIVLAKLHLIRVSTQKTEFGMLISALMTIISLLLMLFYDY